MDASSTVTLNSGRTMPVMGLGTWQLTDATAATIASALALGYRMIDTSGDYGTQPGIGEGIDLQEADRDDFYLVTKVEETDDAYDATRKNLGQLGLDHADLVLIHRPPRSGPGEELWRGLIQARADGLTRDIGVSNYSRELIEALIERTGVTPAVNQIEWTPFGHSDNMLAFAHEAGIVLQAYSPLTRGRRLDEPVVGNIADRLGRSPAQVLIRWNLQKGTVPLPKANRRSHLEENIDVFDFDLTDEEMAALDALNVGYSSLGTLPYA